MKKKSTKFTKEWIELTLCNKLDDLMKNGENKKDKIMKIIKKYSAEIYNSQDYGKK